MILKNQAKLPIFFDRKARLKPNQALITTYRLRNFIKFSSNRHVCLVSNTNSKRSVISGTGFPIIHYSLRVKVSLNTQATPGTIQREEKLSYALPLNTVYQRIESLKKFKVTDCMLHANKNFKIFL